MNLPRCYSPQKGMWFVPSLMRREGIPENCRDVNHDHWCTTTSLYDNVLSRIIIYIFPVIKRNAYVILKHHHLLAGNASPQTQGDTPYSFFFFCLIEECWNFIVFLNMFLAPNCCNRSEFNTQVEWHKARVLESSSFHVFLQTN